MRNYLILFCCYTLFVLASCGVEPKEKDDVGRDEIKVDDGKIRCPKGKHTDSIIPIIYGLPTEETFAKADSGLVSLGGCEVKDDSPNYYCKRHTISFNP